MFNKYYKVNTIAMKNLLLCESKFDKVQKIKIIKNIIKEIDVVMKIYDSKSAVDSAEKIIGGLSCISRREKWKMILKFLLLMEKSIK